MKTDIEKKIAAAKLKAKHDAWNEMTDAQRETVFQLQAKINRLAMAYTDGNSVCAACGAEAYRATGVAGGLASINACSTCDQVEVGQ